MDKSPRVEIVQTVRAGQFESRVADTPCLQGLHDSRLPNTPRGRFELFGEGNGSPMTTAMSGSWRKVLKSPACRRGMFEVGKALRSHFSNRFQCPANAGFGVFRGEKTADESSVRGRIYVATGNLFWLSCASRLPPHAQRGVFKRLLQLLKVERTTLQLQLVTPTEPNRTIEQSEQSFVLSRASRLRESKIDLASVNIG